MNEIRILNGEKLREARGRRTLEEICRASGNRFKPQQISGYEKGKYRPRPQNLIFLLKALNVGYDQVSVPLEMSETVPA
jgi:transcriptional regulator with XRE-family HTH domain